MANYTIELRKIIDIYGIENVKGWFSSYTPTDYITQSQYNKILEAFPNWSPDNLASKIINHYYMNEIAFETPMMFKHFAEIKMQEIMEEKLPLLYSKCISYNPLENVNLTETFTKEKSGSASTEENETIQDSSTKEASGTSTSNGSSSGTSLNINNDTPQGQINKSQILDGSYASSTSANENSNQATDTSSSSSSDMENSTSTKTGSNSGTNTEEENYTRIKSGNNGKDNPDLILKYRQTIIAVEKDIIEELRSLFMAFLF